MSRRGRKTGRIIAKYIRMKISKSTYCLYQMNEKGELLRNADNSISFSLLLGSQTDDSDPQGLDNVCVEQDAQIDDIKFFDSNNFESGSNITDMVGNLSININEESDDKNINMVREIFNMLD